MSTATVDEKELLAGLTEEERAMLAEGDDEQTDKEGDEDDAGDGAGADDESGDDDGDGDDGDAGSDGQGEDGADAGADGGSDAGDQADESQAEAKQAAAPLLVAEAPADAEAKLSKIADDKAALRQRYDDGDVTFEEYEAQKDDLIKQEREIELSVHKAQIAAEMAQQQARNEFLAYAKKFTHEVHPQYAKDKELYDALDQQVRELATLPKYAGMSGAEVLEKAHKLIMIDHPDVFAESKPKDEGKGKTTRREVNLPPNLSKVPAADMNDTGEGRFAHLDKLEGMAYENALKQLSEAERNAYLAT